MILYHGSYLAIEKPDISFSRDYIDFGKGFYTTPIKEQAKKWSERFKIEKGQAVISVYEFDEKVLESGLRVLKFDTHSGEWLDFIIACRTGGNSGNFDIVIGGVANDKVFDTIEAFFNGFYNKAETIERLTYRKPSVQYCFRNQSIINKYLRFISNERYYDDCQ